MKNDIIFDKEVKAITALDLLPSKAEFKKIFSDTGSKLVDFFIIFGVLESIFSTVKKTGGVTKFFGNFEAFNLITGENLKSSCFYATPELEVFLRENYLKGTKSQFSLLIGASKESGKDACIFVVPIVPIAVHDPLATLRQYAISYIETQKAEDIEIEKEVDINQPAELLKSDDEKIDVELKKQRKKM